MTRRRGWGTVTEAVTPERIEIFLNSLAETGNITVSCKEASISQSSVYLKRTKDVEFAKQMEEARMSASDLLEAEAHRRGVEGIERPIMHGGRQVGVIKEYSDRMLELLLKANNPDKFNDKLALTGPGGGPMLVETKVILRKRHERAGDDARDITGGEDGAESTDAGGHGSSPPRLIPSD